MGRGRPPLARGRATLLAAALLATAALLLAGCGAGATPAPSLPPALAAGTYTSQAFRPAATFTVPSGWWNPSDGSSYFALQPVANAAVGIHLFRDALPASQDPSCPATAQPGIGTDALSLATWIRNLPGLTVSQPRIVEVGGLRGTEIDVAIAPGWTASCPFANGLATVPLLVGADGQLRWVVAGSERLRLSILDVPGGGTVVVDIDAFDGSYWESLLSAAAPIVRSLSFATP